MLYEKFILKGLNIESYNFTGIIINNIKSTIYIHHYLFTKLLYNLITFIGNVITDSYKISGHVSRAAQTIMK